jgi:hypothetical protein
MRFLLIAVGLVVGAVAGAALGIAASMALGILSQWTHPDDPSAGSVAIIVVGLFPFGALLGATTGASLVAHWTRKK